MKKAQKISLIAIIAIVLIIIPLVSLLIIMNSKDFTVSFKVDEEIVHTIETKGKESILLYESPSKEGYSFGGWFLDKDIWEEQVTSDTFLKIKLKNNISIYAKWIIDSYTVTVNKNIDSAGTVLGGGSKEYNNSVTIIATTNVGYTWLGWFEGETKVSTDDELTYAFTMPAENKAFEARWSINQYTISFVSNGGNPVDSITQDFSSNITKPADSTREGYTFDDWYIDNNTFTEVYSFTTMPLNGITLYAKWIIDSYTVTTNKNIDDIGSVSGGGSKEYNSSVTLTAFTYDEDAYTWLGWFDGETKVSTDDELTYTFTMPATNKTFEARWLAIAFPITYELNGGDNHAINPETYTIEDTVILEAPIKEGHTFVEWYTLDGEDETAIISISVGTTGAITLYAKWEIDSYLITLSKNKDMAGDVVGGGEKEYNSSVAISAYTAEGYTFVGWFDGDIKVCDDENYIFNMPAADKIYEARWIATILEITYDLYGGVNHINNPTTCTIEESFVLLSPTKEGYDFVRWYMDVGWGAGIPITEGQELQFTRDIRIYAEWSVVYYTITYNLYGGYDYGLNPLTYTIEGAVNLEDPEKEGYDFAGWYEDEEFNTEFLGIEVGTTGNITLYANWTPTVYTITYELYGGENHASNPETYTIEDTVIFGTPTKEEHTFIGWFSDASLSVAFTGITVGTTGYITVYAEWEKQIPEGFIYFGEYPQTEKESSVTVTTTQDSRGYYLGDDDSYYALLNGKYYKVEPILWKILYDDNGEWLLHSTIVLEAKHFNASDSNSYGTSEIRNWLIGDFYNIAFTAIEKTQIQEYTSNDGLVQGDKVFLLGEDEVQDVSLGFENSTSAHASRIRLNTDYSIATGAHNDLGDGYWWLRSPYHYVWYYARWVISDGSISANDVSDAYNGVVPALKIKLS